MTTESAPSRELLGESGPLAKALPGFAPREEQIRLAEAIEASLDNIGTLVAEAGTGTGKTIAYLVPILQSGKRAIISTGTKTLQDQLFFRDLPAVREALGSSAQTALLKERNQRIMAYQDYTNIDNLDKLRQISRLLGPFEAKCAPYKAQWQAARE